MILCIALFHEVTLNDITTCFPADDHITECQGLVVSSNFQAILTGDGTAFEYQDNLHICIYNREGSPFKENEGLK